MDDQYIEQEEPWKAKPKPEEDEQEGNEEPVDIYSKWAIWGFSTVNPIYGGVMLFVNLKKVGYKSAAYTVLAFAISYFFLTSIIVGTFGIKPGLTYLFINFLGGFIMTEVFYSKYFPDDDYYPRPIWGMLAVVIVIQLTMFLTLYFNNALPVDVMKALGKK